MKYKYLQLLIQVSVIGLFFFNLFHYIENHEKVVITGYQALVQNSYFIIGNVMIWVILLSSIFHLITLILDFMRQQSNPQLKHLSTMAVNIQLFIGLFIVTFLGRYLEYLGILMIAIVMIGAFVKHKYED